MEKKSFKAWLYLLPAILFLGFFLVYPLIDVFIYSFEEGYNSASQTYYGVGWYNYSYVLHDPYFLQAIKNTFLLVIITVPLSTLLALLISAALSSIRPLRQAFQTIYFLPYVTNTLAVGLVFMILFKKDALHRRADQSHARMVRRRPGGFHRRTVLGKNVCSVLLHDLGRHAIQDSDPDRRPRLGRSELLQRSPRRWYVAISHFHADYASDDLPDDLLPGHHRLHRCIQILQRRSRTVRHKSERSRDEYDRWLRL